MGPPRALPALALPPGREDRRAGALLSLVFHLLLIALLVTPFAVHHQIIERPQGAGGPGPAGGGGGGHGGTGGRLEQPREKLQFIRLVREPVVVPKTIPQPQPVVPPPTPVVVPPLEPPKPVPTPELPKVDSKVDTLEKRLMTAATIGSGGGSGRDGTNGSGPGSGGGVGSGIGTGRGSGVGPGTGGGTQANFPPSPTEVFLPPFPMPGAVRGFHLVAEYDVDESGRIVSFDFTPTKDRDYNKRLSDVLRSFHFRPGTRPDGTPVRMKAQITYDF